MIFSTYQPRREVTMPHAIITKYLGPTNTKGSRVKATNYGSVSVTISWNHDLTVVENHEVAAKALCDKLGVNSNLVGGELKNGYAWVRV